MIIAVRQGLTIRALIGWVQMPLRQQVEAGIRAGSNLDLYIIRRFAV
jgi:hypothetical protein